MCSPFAWVSCRLVFSPIGFVLLPNALYLTSTLLNIAGQGRTARGLQLRHEAHRDHMPGERGGTARCLRACMQALLTLCSCNSITYVTVLHVALAPRPVGLWCNIRFCPFLPELWRAPGPRFRGENICSLWLWPAGVPRVHAHNAQVKHEETSEVHQLFRTGLVQFVSSHFMNAGRGLPQPHRRAVSSSFTAHSCLRSVSRGLCSIIRNHCKASLRRP